MTAKNERNSSSTFEVHKPNPRKSWEIAVSLNLLVISMTILYFEPKRTLLLKILVLVKKQIRGSGRKLYASKDEKQLKDLST